jgi:hypothetical protein
MAMDVPKINAWKLNNIFGFHTYMLVFKILRKKQNKENMHGKKIFFQ